jgi:hypothetical protein
MASTQWVPAIRRKAATSVECDLCGMECYPGHKHAEDAADGYISMYGPTELADMPFRQFVDRTCDYCQHMTSKND